MEIDESGKFTERVFSFLMKIINPSFSFPGGRQSQEVIRNCLKTLSVIYSDELSQERIIDFCICQAYAISQFEPVYLKKWNISHSFGKKAIERFGKSTATKRYYEDKWLNNQTLTRSKILDKFRDRRKHPLYPFIFPEYEERTKKRKLNTQEGFLICQLSTLLWSPFSSTCRQCRFTDRCQVLTQKKYPELYRIRNTAIKNK